MHALPSAFSHHVSSASRIFVPFAWIAKSTIVVVPPIAAARVPVSKVVRRRRAAERHVEMRVRVDAARQDQQPRCVHNRVPLADRSPRAPRESCRLQSAHRRTLVAVCGDYHAVLNQQFPCSLQIH